MEQSQWQRLHKAIATVAMRTAMWDTPFITNDDFNGLTYGQLRDLVPVYREAYGGLRRLYTTLREIQVCGILTLAQTAQAHATCECIVRCMAIISDKSRIITECQMQKAG